MIQFGHIELFVSDPVKSMAFYRDVLGFDVNPASSDTLVWIQLGTLEILLRKGEPPASSPRYEEAASGVVLYTDNLAETANTLSQRGLIFRGTVDSEKCLTFTDPDGNWFQLVDPHDH